MAGSFQKLSSSHEEANSVQVNSLAVVWDMERDTDGWDAISVKASVAWTVERCKGVSPKEWKRAVGQMHAFGVGDG
eukprot:4875353-Ditylum_brightwellii.AAC.1